MLGASTQGVVVSSVCTGIQPKYSLRPSPCSSCATTQGCAHASTWHEASCAVQGASNKGTTKRSLGHAMGPSFGSLCFGSAILTLVQLIRNLMESYVPPTLPCSLILAATLGQISMGLTVVCAREGLHSLCAVFGASCWLPAHLSLLLLLSRVQNPDTAKLLGLRVCTSSTLKLP